MHLHVSTAGAGARTALLVHGLFSDSTCWHRLVPALVERGYRVLTPDLRGHGASPRGRYSPTDWALDLIDTFAGERIDLAIGHSLGGLSLAIAEHGLDIGRVVHLDPAWRMTAEQAAAFRAEWTSWLSWTAAVPAAITPATANGNRPTSSSEQCSTSRTTSPAAGPHAPVVREPRT